MIVAYPVIGSLPSRALARLSKNTLTHIEFQRETRTYRLGAHIFCLREKQWDIESIEAKGKTSDPCGRDAGYCVYKLNESQMTAELIDYARKVFEWEARRKAATKRNAKCSNLNAEQAHDNSVIEVAQ